MKGRAGGTSGLLHVGGCHGLGPLDTEERHHIDLSRDGPRVEELVGTVLRGDVCPQRSLHRRRGRGGQVLEQERELEVRRDENLWETCLRMVWPLRYDIIGKATAPTH